MSKVTVSCFAKLEDKTAAKVFEGEEYLALTDNPREHRVVLNADSVDPKKSVQVHVKSGARNATDPPRFERVEITEQDGTEPARLTWYGDCDGGVKEVDLNTRPPDETIAPLNPPPNDTELTLEAMIAAGADEAEVFEAIDEMDYKTLEAELLRLKAPVPRKGSDRRLALKDAIHVKR